MNYFIKKILLFVFSFDKYILYKIFKFDSWHNQRIKGDNYCKCIYKYVNTEREGDDICEIGCGLGDIILNTKIKNKHCLDQCTNVLRALKFISKVKFQKVKIKQFNFLKETLPDKYDIIILINWPHTVDPELLNLKISEIFKNNLRCGGSIIIDTVSDKTYQFNHDITYLISSLNCSIHKISEHAMGRIIWDIQKSSLQNY